MSQHPPSPPAATAEEIAHAFEDQVEAVDLSRYSVEDWQGRSVLITIAEISLISMFYGYGRYASAGLIAAK